MKTWCLYKIAKVLVAIVAATLVLGFIVMQLWNTLIPELFKGPTLTFWQAAGLLWLSHLLLRGWGPLGSGRGWHQQRWKHHFEEKLAAMAPEDREKFKAEWQRRCRWHGGDEEDATTSGAQTGTAGPG